MFIINLPLCNGVYSPQYIYWVFKTLMRYVLYGKDGFTLLQHTSNFLIIEILFHHIDFMKMTALYLPCQYDEYDLFSKCQLQNKSAKNI